MEKLKCSSCGAPLDVDDDKEYAKCKYCGLTYKLSQDINIKLDDNIKGVPKFVILPIIILVIVSIIIVSIFIVFPNISGKNSHSPIISNQDISNSNEDETLNSNVNEKIYDEWNINSFNFNFSFAAGTKERIELERILDSIVTSNKTHDRKIVLVFNGKEITDENEIIKVKQSLPRGSYQAETQKYEVLVNYDNDGYINKIIVEKV